MMRYFFLLIILSSLSCNNERVLQLPEIENAEITEILDISPAYIFYDETQPDSTLLNRKNLIISTNWLFNVDKRLTLKQVIPHIQFLQNKKRNAKMHKNENAKNYFTCNDTSISNLGFMEFTDVVYKIIEIGKNSSNIQKLHSQDYYTKLRGNDAKFNLSIFINIDGKTNYYNENNLVIESENLTSEVENLELFIKDVNFEGLNLEFWFDTKMSFQDYISIKSKLKKLETEKIKIDTTEFIY